MAYCAVCFVFACIFKSNTKIFSSSNTSRFDYACLFHSEILFFSIFVLLGSYFFIKHKKTQFYPLISIVLFNVLLLIVSGHIILNIGIHML